MAIYRVALQGVSLEAAAKNRRGVDKAFQELKLWLRPDDCE